MSLFWRAFEDLGGPAAVSSVWHQRIGAEFTLIKPALLEARPGPAASVPCPHECGCAHEVVRHNDGRIVGVCRCESWNCDNLALTEPDLVVYRLNWAKLARALSRAFDCDLKEAPCTPPMTRQIGTFSGAGLPVVLTIQRAQHAFRAVVAELLAGLRSPFVLLAPTRRLVDIRAVELLAAGRAGFVDLESNVTLMPSGLLQARRTGGELFSPFTPEQPDDISDDDARRIYARVLLGCEADGNNREAPLKQVFDLYCMAGFSAQQVAVKLRCSKATVMNRLATLKERSGVSADKLRAYQPFFEKVEQSLSDPRARSVRRKQAIYGHDPDPTHDDP